MLDVVTVGTATRDVFLKSPLFKTVHDPKHLERLGFPTGEAQCFALGSKIDVARPVLTIGGGAANTAVTFARQGFKTAALLRVGADPDGKAVVEDLRREGITPFSIVDRTVGTAYSVILLSSSGERTVLNYRGASEKLTSRDVPARMLRARWVYIVPGKIPYTVITSVIRSAKRLGARVAMDFSKYYLQMGPRKLHPLLPHLDVVHINREEASYLTGVKYDDYRGVFKKLDKLVDGVVAMTDGPKGVMVSDGTLLYKAGIYKERSIADRTGAGDAFGSGFVAALMRATSDKRKATKRFSRETVVEAIRLASANATSVVEYVGAQPGILTRAQFRGQSRWKRFPVKIVTLNS